MQPCSLDLDQDGAPNCANGPIQRERAGSKSDLNLGTAPPYRQPLSDTPSPKRSGGARRRRQWMQRQPRSAKVSARKWHYCPFTAMIEICSTMGACPVALRLRSTGGSGATVVLAGGALAKYLPYTPFILPNSLRSSTYTLLAQHWKNQVLRLPIHRADCAWSAAPDSPRPRRRCRH